MQGTFPLGFVCKHSEMQSKFPLQVGQLLKKQQLFEGAQFLSVV